MQSSADNADYMPDTPDGKETVHVMSIYGLLPRSQGGFSLDPKNLVPAFTSMTPLPTFGKQVKANFFQQCAVER